MIRAPLNGTPPFSELVPRPLLPGQRGDEIVWVDEEVAAAGNQTQALPLSPHLLRVMWLGFACGQSCQLFKDPHRVPCELL